MMKRWKSLHRGVRWSVVILGTVVVLFLAGAVLDRALAEPLRRDIERRFNENLQGYTATVDHVDFHLLGFALDVEGLVVSQNAHPDPPVLEIPRLTANVHWKALLRARLVADFIFESPTLHANLAQLQEENTDEVAFKERGWQDAFQSIYPLKINELRIKDGELTYQDESDFRPLKASHIELLASNIRNIHSKDREYPSEVKAEGALFERGRFTIAGNADFMAKPMPGVKVSASLEGVELDYFEPVVRRYNLTVRQGVLDASGQIEYATTVNNVDLDLITLRDASIDFLYSAAPNERVEVAKQRISETARDVMNDTQSLFRIRKLDVENGTIGFVNRDASPRYRVFVTGADFHLQNLSSRAEDGVAEATLTGSFMGTGEVQGSASFFPEGKEANFSAALKIADTQLRPMNDMLKAHGNFDVAGGVFSLYTKVRVKDGYISGYVKPLFRDMDVYDPRQDKDKNVFRKVYEKVVGGVAKFLENRNRDEVATVVSLSGPVSEPDMNALQIIGRLIQNAFIKSILPGFEGEFKRMDPLRYRSVKREAEREQAPKAPRRG